MRNFKLRTPSTSKRTLAQRSDFERLLGTKSLGGARNISGAVYPMPKGGSGISMLEIEMWKTNSMLDFDQIYLRTVWDASIRRQIVERAV